MKSQLGWSLTPNKLVKAVLNPYYFVLIAAVRNLGPSRPELLPPGTRAFKADPLEVVNSPVEVTMNARDGEVINAIGWPGTTDLYRAD